MIKNIILIILGFTLAFGLTALVDCALDSAAATDDDDSNDDDNGSEHKEDCEFVLSAMKAGSGFYFGCSVECPPEFAEEMGCDLGQVSPSEVYQYCQKAWDAEWEKAKTCANELLDCLKSEEDNCTWPFLQCLESVDIDYDLCD